MLNYRTSEIRGREFNSAHSGKALVESIVSSGDVRQDIHAGLHGACPAPAPLLMCPAASWPPSMTTQPTNVSSPTHRAVNHCLLHHADWSAVRKRWAARGHQWAVINRRPGACLLVAADFLGGAWRMPGVNPLRLSRDFKRVRGDHTDRPSESMHAVVNRTPESWTEPRIHVSVRRSLDTIIRVLRLRDPTLSVCVYERIIRSLVESLRTT